ncbi:phosphoribosylformylglycinamidine cyclo-ligase [Rhabdothermincola sediminis]|uniref:phosphoribosylformylglycinamidine cyclo-ligase n=1 Tax=Rhabdothermincola sediminis TaxID=2751370 RepID=UPI001AA02743|nr:phosphoribosylformylglycinamidine cyclo-ligase [Rhabdothermincola sediminis]
MGETYESAGVSIDAGEEAVERIKDKVRSTFRAEVIGDIGGFGGLFAFDPSRYRQPVLVSSTDGVGTKALVARAAGRFDTIGVDLVAMCVDDLVCQGAEPLFFLDYIAVGRLDPDHIEQLVEGVAEGCRQAGCALIGGEMAEHPGAMEPGEFDLVGFAVGVVDRDLLVTGERIERGDVLIGLPSTNLRSNGYSLARRILFERAGRTLTDPAFDGAHHSVADELLKPSVIFAPAVRALIGAVDVRGVAHVTGGGIPGNLARVLPDNVSAVVERGAWEPPPIFAELQRLGEVSDAEMAKVFNLGIGMIVVVREQDAYRSLDVLRSFGHRASIIGQVVAGDGSVELV